MDAMLALIIISLANAGALLFVLVFSAAHEKNNVALHDLLARVMNLCDMYREELAWIHKEDRKIAVSGSQMGTTDRVDQPGTVEKIQGPGDRPGPDAGCALGRSGDDSSGCSQACRGPV